MSLLNRLKCLSSVLLTAAAFFFFTVTASAIVPWALNINPTNIVSITSFGAVGDDVTTNTIAIQNAINYIAATNNGGTVEIPAAAGAYLCGPITLKSKVNLQIDAGATLKMFWISNWPGSTTFLMGSSIHDVKISGFGTIHGNANFGTNDWWGTANGVIDPVSSRPNFIQFANSSNIMIQNVTLRNPPTFHIMIKNNNANIIVSNITINTPGNSPNTDGFDIASTNVLIEDSHISDGDDDLEIGGSQWCADVLVTNCVIGTGHGISFGSITSGGVSNVTVINCSFTGTDFGIRLKSDNATSGGGSGGFCHKFNFYNLAMTNIVKIPIAIYSYYNEVGTPSSISPVTAAQEPVAAATSHTVAWRDITFSNIVINSPGVMAGIIWGRTEVPATNIILQNVSFRSAKSFDVYNAAHVQFIDPTFTLPTGVTNFLLFNADATISNSTVSPGLVKFDGIATNGYVNTLSFYNARGTTRNTNCIYNSPLSFNASTFAVSNNLTLFPSTVLNFGLGTNAATLSVAGNLALDGTNNITAGAGFGAGTYTLMTYTGTLSGSLPTLGATPPGFNYSLSSATANQINLIVTAFPAGIPVNLTAVATNLAINLKWFTPSNAISYNVKRSVANGGPYAVIANVAVTNYSDTAIIPGTTYYYVVSATNSAGESDDSVQASATPLPSTMATNISFQISGNQMQVSWPQDHIGWKLQIQTNNLTKGLGTNWSDVPNSMNTNQIPITINPTNGSVFLRMMYP